MISQSIEATLDRLGVRYVRRPGSRGEQYNVWECPVCGATHWKVYLNAETGLGNCFKCNATFNTYTFARAHFGGRDRDAMRFFDTLQKDAFWFVSTPQRSSKLSTELTLPDSIPLPYNGLTLQYLAQRQILDTTTEAFGLRYCANGAYSYWADGEERVQDFSNRVLFPIHDIDGRLVSFQGRDLTGTHPKKYLFPTGFSVSGRYLYNAHRVIGKRTIVVGEGVFDALALYQALPSEYGVVATFGKHFGHKSGDDQLTQLRALKRYGLEQVIVAWDGTRDATQAAIKALRVMNECGFDARLARLPEDKDPNEILAAEALYCVEHAEPYSTKLAIQTSFAR